MMTSNVYIIPMDLTRSICSIHNSIIDRFGYNLRWELDEQRREGAVLKGEKVVARLVHQKE